MNKICTTIAQSKKLIELGIDVKTADMYYSCGAVAPDVMTSSKQDYKCYTVCWSLAALFDVLPQEIFDGEYIINITEGCDNRWVLTYDHYENRNHSYYGLSAGADNLIDACYEMIIKLKERNMI